MKVLAALLAPEFVGIAGAAADQAITRPIDSFRPGETVREWWDRATGAT